MSHRAYIRLTAGQRGLPARVSHTYRQDRQSPAPSACPARQVSPQFRASRRSVALLNHAHAASWWNWVALALSLLQDVACRVSPHDTGRSSATHRRKTTFLVRCSIAIGAVLGLAGCAAEPDFQLNSAHLVRLERDFRQPLGERRRDDLQQVLEDLFGTPEHPRIPDVVVAVGGAV